MNIIRSLCLLIVLAVSVPAFANVPADTITMFMIGDSTMADKPLDRENQERGWGQMMPMFFQGSFRISNHAVNGQSSKSFIDSGRWERVREALKPGDYVVIQFGHNDEKPRADRHTDPGSTFDANLHRFIDETRKAGAVPVLMNAIVRRRFQSMPGEAHAEGPVLEDTHGDYRTAPADVARYAGVAFVDMNLLTHNLVQKLGPELSKELFMWIPAGKYEFCPNGKKDNTHLRPLGAMLVARLAVEGMAEVVPDLRPFIRPEVWNLN